VTAADFNSCSVGKLQISIAVALGTAALESRVIWQQHPLNSAASVYSYRVHSYSALQLKRLTATAL
jgi:hypothetical protein